MAATVLTAGLGVVFWALATRLFGETEVGRDGALITAMMALATMCDLSMNNLVVRFLPQLRAHQARRVLTAYGAAGGGAVVGAVAFILIAPKLTSEYAFLADDGNLRAAFIAATVLWSLFVIQDAVLAGAGRASRLPAENGGFGLLKVIAIVIASAVSLKFGIFIGWVLPLLIVVPVVNWLIFTRVIPELRRRPHSGPSPIEQVGGRAKLFSFIRHDIVSTVINQSGTTALPIIVVGIVGAAVGAYFVVPFALISAFDTLYMAFVVAVITESARDPERVGEVVRGAWRRLLTFTIPTALVIVVAAPLLLIPNGPDYMENAAMPLRLLALASVMHAVMMLYGAILRVQSRGFPLMLLQIFNVTATISAVFVLADSHGATGAAAGWLVGMGATALVSLWPLLRFLRNPQISSPNPADAFLAAGE
jgi:O-antigen/teichoic acid export membrane protein